MHCTDMNSSSAAASSVVPHSWLDDIQGFILGTNLVALGIVLLQTNGQMTGGTAGLSFLLHYLTGWSIGAMFFVANLPFFILALWRMGWLFAVKSTFAVMFISLLIHFMPMLLRIEAIAPAYSAIGGGLLIGMGALAFVRHGASVGGVNILSVYMQEKHNISAGKVQIGIDLSILLGSLFVLEPQQLGYSVLGAVVAGLVLAMNHKPGRYMGL